MVFSGQKPVLSDEIQEAYATKTTCHISYKYMIINDLQRNKKLQLHILHKKSSRNLLISNQIKDYL